MALTAKPIPSIYSASSNFSQTMKRLQKRFSAVMVFYEVFLCHLRVECGHNKAILHHYFPNFVILF